MPDYMVAGLDYCFQERNPYYNLNHDMGTCTVAVLGQSHMQKAYSGGQFGSGELPHSPNEALVGPRPQNVLGAVWKTNYPALIAQSAFRGAFQQPTP